MALTVIPANDEKPDWATETQWRAVKAVEEHGSVRKAAAALAHAVGDDVERAYRRGDALRKRRQLMLDWADYLRPRPPQEDAEVPPEE